jgi:hypothetical protein
VNAGMHSSKKIKKEEIPLAISKKFLQIYNLELA